MLMKLKIINCFSKVFNFIFQIYISGAQLPEEPRAESASTRLTEGIRRARQTHHRGKIIFIFNYIFSQNSNFQNPYLNGETIRLDGALRMPP